MALGLQSLLFILDLTPQQPSQLVHKWNNYCSAFLTFMFQQDCVAAIHVDVWFVMSPMPSKCKDTLCANSQTIASCFLALQILGSLFTFAHGLSTTVNGGGLCLQNVVS